MYTLYDFLPSGNGYKVRLTLMHLGLPFRLVEIDILKGQSRTPSFLEKNPNGRIPLLVLPDGSHLSESHAIIWYLAESTGSELLPTKPELRARVIEHLCFEQYNIEPNIAVARFWLHELHKTPEELGGRLSRRRDSGYAALEVLERRLGDADFLVDNHFSLADISLYAYTHVAGEGGFDLDRFPRILAWHERVAAQPGHIPITWGRPSSGN